MEFLNFFHGVILVILGGMLYGVSSAVFVHLRGRHG